MRELLEEFELSSTCLACVTNLHKKRLTLSASLRVGLSKITAEGYFGNNTLSIT